MPKSKAKSYWGNSWLKTVVFLLVAYGLISWAINSGAIILWLAGLFFFGWAATELSRAVRTLRHH